MSLNKILGKLGEHREKCLLRNQKITCFYTCIFQRGFSSTYSLRYKKSCAQGNQGSFCGKRIAMAD